LFEVAYTPLSAACTCGCAGTGVADGKGVFAGTGVCYKQQVFWFVAKA